MAFRSDLSIDWELSPRVVTVADPSALLTVQDLHDTLTDLEDTIEGGQYDNLISSAGKETLKAGVVFVGITSTLQHVVVEFEARTTERYTATASAEDVQGKLLTVAGFALITNGVIRGDLVSNMSDGSHATVTEVLSETQCRTTALTGGVDNEYDIGDDIDFFPVIQCEIDGGNLVAVDDMDVEANPIFPTFGTQVLRTLSSSATLIDNAAGVAEGVWSFNLGNTGLSASAIQQYMASILFGLLSGADRDSPSDPFTFRNIEDLADLIRVESDENGNRVTVTLLATPDD